MKNIVIAPMGDYMDALFVGINEFPTEKVIIITPENRKSEADKVVSDLERFRIPASVLSVKGETEIEVWENIFMAISEIRSSEKEKQILVNVATGDRVTRCAATSAAFVAGLKAFAVSGNSAMMLPVMKFSYYKMIPDKKMKILKILNKKGSFFSLEELSREVGMSLPLISYHINGNLKSEGLKQMGLVETKEDKGRVAVELTSMGRLIIRGYIN